MPCLPVFFFKSLFSLSQAISNVQIIDDFHVVHCKDPKDVVGYLSIMTQYLRSLYSGKTLHAVPHSTFTENSELRLEDSVQHVFTFDEFGRVAEKNKVILFDLSH